MKVFPFRSLREQTPYQRKIKKKMKICGSVFKNSFMWEQVASNIYMKLLHILSFLYDKKLDLFWWGCCMQHVYLLNNQFHWYINSDEHEDARVIVNAKICKSRNTRKCLKEMMVKDSILHQQYTPDTLEVHKEGKRCLVFNESIYCTTVLHITCIVKISPAKPQISFIYPHTGNCKRLPCVSFPK